MYQKIILLTLSILTFSATVCFPQSKPAGPIVPTPNAASLGLYGEVPVSYFTGVPNISVPVYTIKERGFEFPITMSYHAQGFRPDVHPSWVGSNWSLQFGGLITRKLNGFPDEWVSDVNRYYGYYYGYNRLNNSNWSSMDTLLSMNEPGFQRRIDKEPDEFDFNVPGASGKFFLDHLGKWRVQSEKNFKVIVNESDIINPYFNNDLSAPYSPKAFHKFVLIDDAGVKYTFGSSSASTAAIEYSSSITPPDYRYRMWLIATSWYLQSIELPGNTGYINISYVRGPFQSNFQYQEAQNNFFTEPCTPGATSASNYYVKGISGNITSPMYATGITTGSGVNVDFKTSKSNELSYSSQTYMEVLRDADNIIPSAGSIDPQYFAFLNAYHYAPYYAANSIFPSGVNANCFIWFKLDSMIISNNDITNPSVKVPFSRVQFNYVENSTERLRLTSLDFKGNLTGGQSQAYTFIYNGGSPISYLSDLTDHWGFANNTFLVKNGNGWYYWLTGNVYLSRQPDKSRCETEVLTQIIYPTGGKTVFEYELNAYSKCLMDNRQYASPNNGTAGGLRIKKISNIDPVGKTTTKEYYYVFNYNNSVLPSTLTSSGVLERMPKYSYSVNTSQFSLSMYSSNGIAPMSSNSGIFCSYSEVAEKYQDGSYRIFKFTNHDNGYIDIPPIVTITPFEMGVPTRSTDFERGQLVSETVFSSTNTIVQKTEYTFTRIGSAVDSNFVRSFRKDFGGYCMNLVTTNPYASYTILSTNGFQVPVYIDAVINPTSFAPYYTTATAYGYYVYKFLKDKATTTTYPLNSADNQPSVSEILYQYDQWGNLTKTTETNSGSSTIYHNFKYPYHFTGTAVYDAMISRNMTGLVIEANKYDGTNFIESEKTEYDFFNSSVLIKPRYLKKKIAGNSEYNVNQFNVYDSYGNIREFQGIDEIKKSFLWGYFSSRQLASISGSDDVTVQAAINPTVISAPTSETQLATEIDKIRTNIPGAFVTTYLYDQTTGLNPKKIKDANGKSMYYEYDHLGRLITIKDNDLNILKKNEYKFNEPFSFPFANEPQGTTFTPTGTCDPGYVTGDVTYSVPAGRYGSFISVNDANLMAIAEINANGQSYADATYTCIPYWSYVPCCTWGSPYSNYNLTGTGSVDFSIVVFKMSGTTTWTIDNQIANLSGLLFLPSANRMVTVITSGRTWTVTFKPGGQVSMFLVSGTPPSASTSIQLAGTYVL